jgi:predicted RNA-binding Zn-ribbon protein involved in translation (DUF1610 family)
MSEGNRKLILGGVVIVALGAIAIYRWSTSDAGPGLRQVTLLDRTLTWRCLDCGHVASEQGAPGPKPCPKCGKEQFYVSEDWACRQHGVFKIAVQFDENAKYAQFKYGKDSDWVSALDEEGDPFRRCPKCNESLVPPQGLPAGG